jgi:ER-bound oxygenase mpaB/B'/Rubber oxygenase, catalytic domain
VHRDYWAHRIAQLNPATDFAQIYRILVAHEFPWDMNQSLSFALFRTYAVPSIGQLLATTGEFTQRTQKRYDDTGLILDTILEHGLTSTTGRTALRRMNQMHGAYPISNEDMRYVLTTFVVVPMRWLDRYGWRQLSEAERVASCNYYRELGRNMGIKDIPATYQEFATLMDSYERRHFAFDPAARTVADATLTLLTTFPPNHHAPAAVIRRFSFALMDDALLDAFGYPHPSTLERRLATSGLRLRARLVRRLPVRIEPRFARDLPNIHSYPHGYDVAQLGVFPRTAGNQT